MLPEIPKGGWLHRPGLPNQHEFLSKYQAKTKNLQLNFFFKTSEWLQSLCLPNQDRIRWVFSLHFLMIGTWKVLRTKAKVSLIAKATPKDYFE